MDNDFSEVYNRRHTGSFKWLELEGKQEYDGAFPFSVADMEWRTPPEIRKACAEFAEKGFYCYTSADEHYCSCVSSFMQRRHNWDIENDWIVCTYGIVSAIHTAVKCFTEKGDGVIIQRPVYRHFEDAVLTNDRELVNNALICENGSYYMNFEELERLASKPENKMLILCSPHNPVGRVWTKEELTRLADICYKNNVIIVSDEIHFDITRTAHTVLPSIDPRYYKNTIVCTAVSKSFNIAGLSTSNIIIGNSALRERFIKQIEADGYSCINSFSYPATLSALGECDYWLDEMNRRVDENFELLADFIEKNMPRIKLTLREGTYLAWLNVSCFGVPDSEIVDFFAKNAGVYPSAGDWFGTEGSGYIRLNIAVPSKVLISGLERMKILYDGIK